MANPPKKKGTGYETATKNSAISHGRPGARRFENGGPYDVHVPANVHPDLAVPIEALFSRPDRGQTLVTIREEDFWSLLQDKHEVHIECKRFARMVWHTIFESKFGRR